MKTRKVCQFLLSAVLACFATGAFAQEVPTADSIIEGLKGDAEPAQAVGTTRALRPGAAASATAPAPAATAPTPAPRPAASKPASVSLSIAFDFNSDSISSDSLRTMETLAKALSDQQLQHRTFTIVGHTDGVGSAAYNQALSERRAASVKRWLVENGVESSRLRTVGRGKSQLINKRDPAAAENRRVEVQATGG